MNIAKKVVAVIAGVALLLSMSACNSKTPEDENDLKNEMENVQNQMNEVAEENSQKKVGEYVTPSESDFTWEPVENGVAITAYTGSATAVIIPDTLGGKNVVEIRNGSFSQTEVLGIQLPNTLTTVTENAFFYCTTLVEVYFSDSVQQIAGHAFEGCIALSSVHLNAGLQSIGESAFANCQSLNQIELNNGLVNIGNVAFCMSSVKNIKIPGTVHSIGVDAFASCEGLEKVEIESGVQTISKTAFQACFALKEAIIPASVTEIGLRAFDQCENLTIYAPAGSAAEAYATEDEIPFEAV